MSGDNSLATQTEDWIVETIRGIEVDNKAVFEAEDVTPWEGTEQYVAREVATEVLGDGRDRIVRVWFASARRNDLGGDETEMIATYAILIAVKSGRPAAPRRGDDATPHGTNALRDLLFDALDQKWVNAGANGRYANDARFMGWEPVLARKGSSVIRVLIEVRETPTA